MVAGFFFRRRRVEVTGGQNGLCDVVPMPNLDEFLWLPVSKGLWRQHELWDGTYCIDDLLDAVEMIVIKRERETMTKMYNFLH